MAMQEVIVSRHKATIQWILSQVQEVDEIIGGNATADDVRGKVVYGNIPFHLAQHAHVVNAVEFEGTPPRGQEYSVDDMIAAGVRLVPYLVIPAANRPICMQCGV